MSLSLFFEIHRKDNVVVHNVGQKQMSDIKKVFLDSAWFNFLLLPTPPPQATLWGKGWGNSVAQTALSTLQENLSSLNEWVDKLYLTNKKTTVMLCSVIKQAKK